jgi:hypothetical protein
VSDGAQPTGSRPTQAAADAQRTGEYWTLVPRDAGEVAVINATGYRVFQLCDGSRPEADIVRAIADSTGTEVEQVAADVATYVSELVSAGLLSR